MVKFFLDIKYLIMWCFIVKILWVLCVVLFKFIIEVEFIIFLSGFKLLRDVVGLVVFKGFVCVFNYFVIWFVL